MEKIGSTMTRLLLALIRAYQLLFSPWVGSQCRFYPTCSAYAQDAIRLHGATRGSWFAIKRLARCHPWNAGGIDVVPPPSSVGPKNG